MSKNKYISTLTNGLFKENPTFVLMLGMCPTLAVTTSADQRPRHGTFHDSGTDAVQLFHWMLEKRDSG